jgi:hypothetical protein
MPPAKKPILTLLKQARAFGVGMLLSTQNPMDLDYKAMSNAGTWCIGLLQTERDKARILEALASAAGGRDLGRLDTLISGLGKRQFLLHNTREKQPILFGTRFAMSYMRGPLTLPEIAGLTADDPRREEKAAPAAAEATPVLAEDEMTALPRIAAGVPVYHLDPGAPWAEQVGARRGGTRLAAALAVRAHLTFRDATAGLHETEEWEAIFHPLTAQFDPAAALTVDYDARDFRAEAPVGATFQLPAADLSKKTYFTAAGRALKEHLTRARTREVQHNRALKLYSRAGETPAQFASRCDAAAGNAADVEAAKIRDRFEGRLRDLRRDIDEARLEADQAAREQEAQVGSLWEPAVGVLVDILFKGRSSGRRSTSTASRAASVRRARDRRERAEADLTGKVGKLEDLEGDLADELAEIDSAWDAKAAQVETIKIALSKTNVTVDEVAVVWLPVA